MREGEPPQGNHNPGAGQHGNAKRYLDPHNVKVARPHHLKKDALLRLELERVITQYLHDNGVSSYDEIYIHVHFTHRHLLVYLDNALANLAHRGNGHTPEIINFLEGGSRMYYPNQRCDGELERQYQEAREIWMSYRQGLILDEDLEEMWNDMQGWE